MAKGYRQLTRLERRVIKEGLDHHESFREIARELGRSPSTISREVRVNRVPYRGKTMKVKCPERRNCEKTALCGKNCIHPHLWCADCKDRDCRELCESYELKRVCPKLTRAPWVCNGCPKLTYGCHRPCRVVYNVSGADEASKTRRSESRSGIATTLENFEDIVARIKDGLSRGLSPYEISVLFAEEVDVSASTIYRWVEAGYGDMANIELERKVGFRPRRKKPQKKSTSHSRYRSYDAFSALSDEVRASRTEMDTLEGRACDVSCVLTLYYLPCKIQFLLKLSDKTSSEVKRALKSFRAVCPAKVFEAMFSYVLTDNGGEFSDERGIGAALGERRPATKNTRLFFCDPRESQQKGGCEKNHSEVRQILEKGLFSFDELGNRDLAVVMSHVNSTPRASLCGMSPIDMFLTAFGDDGRALLDALGVEKVDRDHLTLKPKILNAERTSRGEEPLTYLK